MMEGVMTKRMTILLACGAWLALTGVTLAKPLSYKLPDETATFRPGPGVEAARNNCAACHSADYINFQAPKMGQAFWEVEVQKMIKLYHAPIDGKDAKTITDYLAKTY
jgi:mono/diheme cytochrome c family protein